ncbi:hypothetical protein D3C80_1809870 [compost metagenome]
MQVHARDLAVQRRQRDVTGTGNVRTHQYQFVLQQLPDQRLVVGVGDLQVAGRQRQVVGAVRLGVVAELPEHSL